MSPRQYYDLSKLDWPGLAELPERVIRRAMGAIVEAVTTSAREEAPKRRGRLRRSIKGEVERGGRRGVVKVGAPHAHLIHAGTKSSGRVKPRKSRAMLIPTAAGRIPRASFVHKGIAANPFLERGRDNSADEVAEILAGAAEDEVER